MNRKNQNMFMIVIISVITILFWVGFEVVRSYYTSTIPQVIEDQIKALNPKIDLSTLQNLKERIHINEQDLVQTIEQTTVLSLPVSTPISASISAQALPTTDDEELVTEP